MYLPSNFHEDSTRHYLLKLERAKESGHNPNVKPRRKPSRKTMAELSTSPHLSPQAKANLRRRMGNAQPDFEAAIFQKLSPEVRRQLMLIMT